MHKQSLRFTFLPLMYLTLPLTVIAQVIDIPDLHLRTTVEKVLGKASGAPITTADMANLTRLDAPNANISDLTGLEYATNLTTLNLGGEFVGSEYVNSNSISNISPIAKLTNLTLLNLWGNNILDISTVAGLTNLTSLYLGVNHISNISVVADLTALIDLGLESNTISDLSPLAELTNLRWLNLGSNTISEMSVLVGLMQLTWLNLGSNNVFDISALVGLTQLKTLYLWDNAISDISAIAGLTNLETLNLNHNSISDISPLVANTGLGSGDEIWLHDNPLGYSAIKTDVRALQNRGVTVQFEDTTHLNTGEPRTVRMIYFLPNDRQYRANIVQKMKDEIRRIQTFYAHQMGAHGYGNKTFRIETDSQGEPIAHRVDGLHPDSYYLDYTEKIVTDEIGQIFNFGANIYLVVVDNSINALGGEFGGLIGGEAGIKGKQGGWGIVHSGFNWSLAAHELGHAFGLWHDFRESAYLMSWGPGQNRLSACHAAFLAMHSYFNPDTPVDKGARPTIDLISPHTYPLGSQSVPVQLKISDSEGLHWVILFIAGDATKSPEVKACRGLGGDRDSIIEFDYDGVIPSNGFTNLSSPLVHPIDVEAIDTDGNVGRASFVLFSEALQPLSKISGDNQYGLPNGPLPIPFVVEVWDLNNVSVRNGVPVTFTVTAGSGTLSTTIARTDENGRAQSTLTLGPNLGTNTVEVSAAGIEHTVTFYAISDTEAPLITADINSDGSVNVLDLVMIASELGNKGQNLAADASGDGVVNALDLILVAGLFDSAAAAPSAQPQVPETLTAVEVQGWLTNARTLEIKDSIMKRGVLVLEQLLISLTPKETELLANYPNPFNPETWIPYRLAEDAFVTLTIYDTAGQVVRTLEVGHRIASAYESRSKAIHWDGRNNLGEQAASGVYFYTLTAGDFSATRKMLILK